MSPILDGKGGEVGPVWYTVDMMVREGKALYEFERREAARLEAVLTPEKALRLYDSMWERAKAAGALRRADPLEGIEVAIEVARTVNALKGPSSDIEDIRGVLARQQGKVDREYLRHWIRQFAQIEGKGHLATQLDELLAEFS